MKLVFQQGRKGHLVHICCVCGEVRDDVAGDDTWHNLKEHMHRYGISEGSFGFSHTFCPPCLMVYEKQLGLECALDLFAPSAQLRG